MALTAKKDRWHHWRSVYLHYIIFPVSFFPRPWWMQQKIEPSLSNCLIWNMDGGGALQIMTILADVTWLELTMNTLSHLFKVKFLVVLLWRFIVNFEHMSRAYLGLFFAKTVSDYKHHRCLAGFQLPEVALQRWFSKKVFWKYASKLQENTYAEVRFQ